MIVGWKDTVARRPLLAALALIAGAGAAGTLLYEGAGRRTSGPYGDLLSEIGDSESAAVVGHAVLAQSAAFDPANTAHNLRATIGRRPLADVLSREAALGEVLEVRGWVLPKTLAALCALAAQKSGAHSG